MNFIRTPIIIFQPPLRSLQPCSAPLPALLITHPPSPLHRISLPPPPPSNKAQHGAPGKRRKREPDERRVGLCLPAPFPKVDVRAHLAGAVDAAVRDDVVLGVRVGGAIVDAEFDGVGLFRMRDFVSRWLFNHCFPYSTPFPHGDPDKRMIHDGTGIEGVGRGAQMEEEEEARSLKDGKKRGLNPPPRPQKQTAHSAHPTPTSPPRPTPL